MTTAVKGPKRTGKENAPPTRTIKSKSSIGDDSFDQEGDSFGAIEVDEVPAKLIKSVKPVSTKPPLKPSKSKSLEADEEEDMGRRGSEEVAERGIARGELNRKMKAMTAERDRLRSQRDTFSKQFEELSKLRTSDMEGLFDKYKEKAALQAKAQNEIISNLSALNDKLSAKALSLEKALKEATALPAAGAPFEAPVKADPKEVKMLKEELAKSKAALRDREDKYTTLEREHKAEIEHSRRTLQTSTSKPTASTSAISINPEEAEKDAASLKLYEDITDLNITSVKIKPAKGGKDVVFNCVQTVEGRSLNFKLRTYNDFDNTTQQWKKTVLFAPELKHETDKAFIKRLGVFMTEFTVEKEQLSPLWESLKSRIAVSGDVEALPGDPEGYGEDE